MSCLNCASRSCNVHGVDYSRSLISVASSSVFGQRNFHVGDIADASFLQETGEQFELILSHSVFFYLNNYDHADRVLAVMKKALSPSGQIILSDIPDLEKRTLAIEMRRTSTYYQSQQPKENLKFDGDHLYYRKSFFREMAVKHDFEVLEIVDESDLPLAFYEPSKYRFLVRMAHQRAARKSIESVRESWPSASTPIHPGNFPDQ